MRWIVEQGIDDVPLVPAAVIYDISYAKGSPPPDAALAYAACLAANAGPVPEGNVGAGAGATAGKIYGTPLKSGLGTASLCIPGGPWSRPWRWSIPAETYGVGGVYCRRSATS
jgi:L-aminopeptidase/D-esterase-like protein